tara:strand:+ start:29399 stop:30256 length:858 start_codon:yes stop_codon:yes gene_type:complete
MSLVNTLTALALSLGVNATAAPPPAPAKVETPWVVQSVLKKEIPDFSLSLNLTFQELYPQNMQIKDKDSMLHEVDLETVTLMTLGLSLDYDLYQLNLGSNINFDLPIGIDFNFSSSELFGEVIDDKGKMNRSGMKADYSIEGNLNYIAFGVRLLPNFFYRKGQFKMGVSMMAGSGISYVESENNYSAAISGKETREFLQKAKINPDILGNVSVSGLGGFFQLSAGPVVGAYNITCTYNVGYRHDIFSFYVVESSNSALIGLDDKTYGAEYDKGTMIHTIGCGVEF